MSKEIVEEMEDKDEKMNDVDPASSNSSFDDSDADEPSTSGQDDRLHLEAPLTEEEIEELIAELVEVESKAAEAQESLEDESLARVEAEVRAELAQTLEGDDDLDKVVADEMATFKEEWEAVLDELETESANLLEQLDGAGVELPSLFKWIEGQAPNGCCTESWKKRIHWVGSQVTGDVTESVAEAEKYLQTHRPVRRRHGKIQEEGASGFLGKKLALGGGGDGIPKNSDADWSSLKKLFSDQLPEGDTLFGSNHWSCVYLASTPQQAAAMGFNFPGVNEVEEIDDLDGNSSDPFVAEAIANEIILDLSEEQMKNFRKVREEDDVSSDLKLQLHLKQKRHRNKFKQETLKNEISADNSRMDSYVEDLRPINVDSDPVSGNKSSPSPTDMEEDQPVLSGNKVDSVPADSLLSDILNEDHHCTVCDKVATKVHSHPVIKVIVCSDCKSLLEAKMHLKDPNCSDRYCLWCGQSCDLLNCRSCKTLFCTACVKRNFGEQFLVQVRECGWQCCCCSPPILQKFSLELEKAEGARGLEVSSSETDSDLDNSDADINVTNRSKPSNGNLKRRRKKKIRRILEDAELGEETKRKIAIEKERQERLKSLGAQFSAESMMKSSAKSNGNLSEGASVDVLGDASTGYIVNVVREKGEEAVRIPPSISAQLKAHQISGIRFMWENIIQSIGKVKSGDKGLGCILAHTMGLGKTFQVIAFLYAAMRSVDLGLRTALIVTPVSVLHNWRKEFQKWSPLELKRLRVFMLDDVPRERRPELLAKWRRKGGIFLIGYTAFRNLSLGKHVKDRHIAREICYALQDGPDILVCDEAHIIKNTRADVTQALKQVKCQRRIALTGSPLQNNLMEYYCMVDFVREGFLGSSHEFRNRFQNPIENGQHTNSTSVDVKIMNQRSHILYEQLKGFVQRMDMNVVKKDLPPKTVFVLAVKLSPLQRQLYKKFLEVHGFANEKVSSEKLKKSNFFAGYQALAQIWNHPGILHLMKEKEYGKREDVVEPFLADDSSSDDNSEFNIVTGEKLRNKNGSLQRKNDNGFLHEDWWNDLLQENNYKEVGYSGKMVLLLDILTMSCDVGDKVLVFSQSLSTLDLIEFYLSKLTRQGKKGKSWKKGKDWYRLDGRTEGSERQRLVERFNEPLNRRVKCTLISTRAGSLGINLHAANRVIIVDGSWNPTYDLQAIYRVWRYGQTKPVFAYRLMAHGTMEEKIYKRQVTKEGLAARVMDRQQVHRTISKEEMLHLFAFGDDEESDIFSELGRESGDVANQKVPIAHGSCSSDKLMESLLGSHYPRWIANYHEHETLFQENEDERLSKEEQDMAWEVYRRTLEWEEVQRFPPPVDESAAPESRPVGGSTAANRPPVPESTVNHVQEQSKGYLRNVMRQSTCTNLSHASTLKSRGMKAGCSTICRECEQEISWESINRCGSRNRYVRRKCTNLSHMLTLRSQGIKIGKTTVCGECAVKISWEDLK